MNVADLECTFRRQNDGQITLDMRLRVHDSERDSDLALGALVALRPDALLPLTLDANAYGRALTEQLFANPQIREGWVRAQAFAEGADSALRLRLRLDPSADDLHALRWETLRDPATDRLLCRSEQILFSRYIDSGDLGRVTQRPRPAMRALAAIANPSAQTAYGLAPINALAEQERIAAALGTMPLRVLGQGTGHPPASLSMIVAALREGYGIFYLMCHGVLGDGRPYLWLESDDERPGRVPADELVNRIAELPPERRPLLVVLASCQSAGAGYDVLAALGPSLARAGVPAVLAMQGSLPIPMAERLMPAFFRTLMEDGQIDRALAAARSALNDDDPWWMPSLLMQVRNGRVWSDAPDDESEPAGRKISDSLNALAELARDEQVRKTIIAFITDFQTACTQIDLLNGYKKIHDGLQQLEDTHQVMVQSARRLPSDETAWSDLEEQAPEIYMQIADLLRIGAEATATDGLWIQRLERARTELETGIEQHDASLTRRGLNRVAEVLGRELSRMNTALVTAARGLRLQQLLTALTIIRDELASEQPSMMVHGQFTIFADGVAALARINARLGVLVATHDAFQEVDDELRRVKELLAQDVDELVLAWADISRLVQRLYEINPGDWASKLSENSRVLDAAVAAREFGSIKRAFRNFRHLAIYSFQRVDQDLLSLCSELQQIVRPTEAVLKMLA